MAISLGRVVIPTPKIVIKPMSYPVKENHIGSSVSEILGTDKHPVTLLLGYQSNGMSICLSVCIKGSR